MNSEARVPQSLQISRANEKGRNMSFTATRMSISSIALKQGESVDDNGRAIIPPDMLSSPSNGDFTIAPWLQTNDEPVRVDF